MNIYQRINEIRKAVTYVQKDALVTGYKAVTHDQVTAALREMMVQHGVVTVPTLKTSQFSETGDLTAKGTKWMLYQATYQIRFVNIDEPSDFVEVEIESQALDNGDKATGKAMSYAVKYAMLKIFSLETGESDEGRQDDFRQKREEKERINTEQKDQLIKLIEESGADLPKLLAFYKISKLEEMSVSEYNKVKIQLEAKRDANH